MNFLKIIIPAIIIISLLSCSHRKIEEIKKPDVLLDQEIMSKILADVHIAEAIISEHPADEDSMYQASADAYALICKKYDVNIVDFKNSFEYYKLQPVVIDSIYSKVITRLSEEETKFNTNQIRKQDTAIHAVPAIR